MGHYLQYILLSIFETFAQVFPRYDHLMVVKLLFLCHIDDSFMSLRPPAAKVLARM